MDLNNIILAVTAISMIVSAFYTIREARDRRRKSESESDVNVTAAVENLSNALGLTSKELVETLADSANLRDELSKQNKKIFELDMGMTEMINLRAKDARTIKELEASRSDDERKIANLQAVQHKNTLRIEELESVIEEGNKRYATFAAEAKTVIKVLVQAFRDKGFEIPDINGELSDTIRNWIWGDK